MTSSASEDGRCPGTYFHGQQRLATGEEIVQAAERTQQSSFGSAARRMDSDGAAREAVRATTCQPRSMPLMSLKR